MSRWSPRGIVFELSIAVAGYCLDGKIGLGVGALIIAIVQFLS